ncbi:MAG: hypothetical protein P1U89_23090 [Verrucomicrobiales bacterium]|nr:hypothetical protein [Verrucomicrobiales bacterium]
MIRFLLFSLIFSVLIPFSGAQDRPSAYSLDRYSVIWQKSMFARQTKDRGLPNSSIYWNLAGVFSYDGGRGAVIVNQATGAVEQVEENKKNASGLCLLDVIENHKTGAASVKIEQNGKTFWVSKLQARQPQAEPESSSRPAMYATEPFQDDRKSVAVQ